MGYAKMTAAGKKWEIIFASSDQSEKEFTDYFGEMPWKALPHGDERKDELDSMFEVSGIPTLVVIDAKTGNVISKAGRAKVESDKAKGETTMMWLWAGEHELVERVRQVCKVPASCKLAVLDVGEGVTYQSDVETVTADAIDSLTKDFQAGKLEGTSFK